MNVPPNLKKGFIMTNLNKKSGFTLIEIIVVLIIVGVLAAIALPNLFGNVKKSKSQEALKSVTSFKQIVEGCISAHPATAQTNCSTLSLPATGNFTYTVSGLTNGGNFTSDGYTIRADGKAAQGFAAGDYILLTRSSSGTPSFICQSYGALQGACSQ